MRINIRFGVLCVLISSLISITPAHAEEDVTSLLKSKVLGLTEQLQRPEDRSALSTFYGERGFGLLWVNSHGLTPAGRQIVAELAAAGDWGLSDSDFTLTSLDALHNGPITPQAAADADFEISAAILRYVFQARGGRISAPERLLTEFLDRHPQLVEALPAFRSVATAEHPDVVLRSFHPRHPQFQKLRDALVTLRRQQTGGARALVPRDGQALVPGTTHEHVKALRRRFAIPAAVAGQDDLYDDALARAVKAFQTSVRIRPDGIVGRKTRKALQVASGPSADTLIANMEQWRWMPDDLGAKHLFVNIPSYTLKLMDGETVAHEERVIVGKATTPTPAFTDTLSTIVLKPMWLMPDSIKREKLLQAQRRGRSIESSGYTVQKGKRIVKSWTVDWSKVDLSHYAIYQPAGDGNALGDLKFLFPNKHSVYLHDTPNKSLFAAAERTFSHGCVRLRNPVVLAQLLLDADKGKGLIDVKKTLRTLDDSNEIMLRAPLPIHIAYFTVWAREDGSLEDLGDPYKHIEKIQLGLANRTHEIERPKVVTASLGDLRSYAANAKPKKVVKSAKAANARKGLMGLGRPPVAISTSAGTSGKRRREMSVGDMMQAALR